MGLTDAPQQLNITDVYPEGTPFCVIQAWVEGVVKTQFGDRTMAKIVAEPVGAAAGQAQEFSVWGSLCEQVQSVDPAELPLTVKIVKDGKRYLFEGVDALEAAGQVAAGTPTADESALGVAPGPGEGTPPTALATPPVAPAEQGGTPAA